MYNPSDLSSLCLMFVCFSTLTGQNNSTTVSSTFNISNFNLSIIHTSTANDTNLHNSTLKNTTLSNYGVNPNLNDLPGSKALPHSSVVANRTSSNETVIPLNGYCIGDAPKCGSNAFCSPSVSRCECKLGFESSLDGVNCEPFACASTGDCFRRYGSGSACQFGQCLCDASFQLDVPTQRCFAVEQPLDGLCVDEHQCGTNAICSTTNKCRCKYGFAPSQFNSVNCDYFACQTSAQCLHQFGPHSECSKSDEYDSNFCGCNSTSGWNLNQTSQVCTADRRLINQTCSYDSDCGQNAVCTTKGAQVCTCKLGFAVDSSLLNCVQFHCANDGDCRTHIDPNSVCFLDYQCICDQNRGYRVSDNQTCEAKGREIGAQCTSSDQCGSNAQCIADQCRCRFGDVPNSDNRIDCLLKLCASDSDCVSQVDHNSECRNRVCVCKPDYHVDTTVQSCNHNSAVDNPALVAGVLIAVVVVCSVGAFLLGLFIKGYRLTWTNFK